MNRLRTTATPHKSNTNNPKKKKKKKKKPEAVLVVPAHDPPPALRSRPRPRGDFAARAVAEFARNPSQHTPEALVASAIAFFKTKQQESTRPRVTTWRSSAQSALSRVKAELGRRRLLDTDGLRKIRLPKHDMNVLNSNRQQRVHDQAIGLALVEGDRMIRDCRAQLLNPAAPRALRVIALAALTGRRATEILLTARFAPPQDAHRTHPAYWARVSGLLKQRGKPRTVEVPLLAPRRAVLRALQDVRGPLFPLPPKAEADPVRWVNRKYSKELSAAVRRYCPQIGRLHDFRKFYAAACVHYFNQNTCNDARVTADYLGHSQMTGTVLTYMNFKLVGLGSLDFARAPS